MSGLKKTDFIIAEGIQKPSYKRNVTINGKTKQIIVTLSKNHNKGEFHIEFKWDADKITGDDVMDRATLELFAELALKAVSDGVEWKREWNDANSDTNQLKIPEAKAENKIKTGFKKKAPKAATA